MGCRDVTESESESRSRRTDSRGRIRKPSRRGGRAAGSGRGGSRIVGSGRAATEPRSISQQHHENQHHYNVELDNSPSALGPGEIVLDSLGMHITSSTSPFSLGDFPTQARTQLQQGESGVDGAAADRKLE